MARITPALAFFWAMLLFLVSLLPHGAATSSAPPRPASSAPAARAALPLSISISGNHFVDGAGHTVRLLGVDAPGTEYACEQGWGYSGQSSDAAEAAIIAGWHATAVRIPLNEDCWLGINNTHRYGTATGYRQFIATWVNALNAAGLYAILDLHWTAPGSALADGQRPMPDANSTAFWASLAQTYAANRAVVFDAFNEPYSPDQNGNSNLAVSWTCWRDGGCAVPIANQDGPINDAQTYSAVGMQTLVTTIRDAGATQPILLGGLSYANDLSGWLAAEPTDPAGQLAASWHEYDGEACAHSCWTSTIATVAAHVPVVIGEFDEGYDCVGPPAGAGTWDTSFLQWADSAGVSYLAWGWWVLDDPNATCAQLGSAAGDTYALTSDSSGTAVAPDGTTLQAHLAALAGSGSSGPSSPGTPSPAPYDLPTNGPPHSVCRGSVAPVCTN